MRGFSLRRLGAESTFAVLITAFALVAMAALPSAAAARRHRHRARHASFCPSPNIRVNSSSGGALRAAVVCLINQERAAHGLPGLRASRRLNRSAQGWTNAMVERNYFGHGSNFAARISAVGFNWSMAGENIAAGFGTPRQLVDGWMSSTGHCENILNPAFREVGTGVSAGSLDGTSSGTWTEDYGLGMNQRPLSGNRGPMSGCPY